jgi:S1-C subfamily serine protease
MLEMKAALSVLLLLASLVSAFAWDSPAMNRQIDQTNFLVNDNCSATLIDAKKGYLLTANHCIKAQFTVVEREKIGDDGKVTTEKVRVATPGTVSQLYFKDANEAQRNSYVFKIKLNDADLDLALIQVQAKLSNTDQAPVACADPQRGDTVFAVGNSAAILYASVSKGIVASVDRNYRMIGVDGGGADYGLIHSTTAIGGGNSGGSLYNDKGEIVGVVVRGYQNISPLGLSVPLHDIKRFLTREGLNVLWDRCS